MGNCTASSIFFFFYLFLRERCCDGPLLTPASSRTWRRWPRASERTWTLPKAWIPTKTRSIMLWSEWPPRLCDRFNSEMSLTQCVSPWSPRRAIPHCFLPGADHPHALLGPPEPLFQPCYLHLCQGRAPQQGALFSKDLQSNNLRRNAHFYSSNPVLFICFSDTK